MPKYIRSTFISLFFLSVEAQVSHQTEFYRFTLPTGYVLETFDNKKEEFSNVNSYKVTKDGKLKYILFLMSNKMNSNESITEDNYLEFIFDLESNMKITFHDIHENTARVAFNYVDNDKVVGLMYISIFGDILNRFVFIMPNFPEIYEKNSEDIYFIISNMNYLKESW